MDSSTAAAAGQRGPLRAGTAASRLLLLVRLVLTTVLVAAPLWLGCSAPPPLGERELYDQGNIDFESGDFNSAISKYDELLEQHPFSDLAEVARLRVAHAFYLNHSYEKATAAFSDFERLHPTSPLLPFVEYTMGMCWLDQARTRDRDKSASENAERQFERLHDRYPNTLYGRLAEFRLHQCHENLADHELYVAEFYVKMHKPLAAEKRYRFLVENYPDSDAASLAKTRLGKLGSSTAEADTNQANKLDRNASTTAESTPMASR
jgi:outer membrane protein assembly factor BamD